MRTKKKPPNPGIGMPAALLLENFGRIVRDVFDGEVPYHVGSSLFGKKWRDVDVRIILDDEMYESMGLGKPTNPHGNRKWVAMTLALSFLGQKITGLPIDFQIQQRTHANKNFSGTRSALGITR